MKKIILNQLDIELLRKKLFFRYSFRKYQKLKNELKKYIR